MTAGTTKLSQSRRLEPKPPDNLSVKLVGLGGVGRILARRLGVFFASLDIAIRMLLIDGDNWVPANASRVLCPTEGNKASATTDELLPYLGDTKLTLGAIEEFVTEENKARIIREGDLVALAVDSHVVRRLISDHCGTLSNVVLVSGGNDGIEELPDGRVLSGCYGNAQIYSRRDGRGLTHSLTRFHPEIANAKEKKPDEESCGELLSSVPQLGFANAQAAACICNSIYLLCSSALHYSEIAFDIADGVMRPVPIPRPEGVDPDELLGLSHLAQA